MPSKENTPLLSGKGGDEKNFYFLEKTGSQVGDDSFVNNLPPNTTPDSFKSRPVVRGSARQRKSSFSAQPSTGMLSKAWNAVVGGGEQQKEKRLKMRKVPIKVEPKVFFANERTFLAWLHTALTLASISIAIVSFSADAEQTEGGFAFSQMYGLTLLPVSIAFVVYALRQYTKRAGMIRRREPGPYEDVKGPVVLAVMLMMAIFGNFAIKLVEIFRED